MIQYNFINRNKETVGKAYSWFESEYDSHIRVSLIQLNGNCFKMHMGTSFEVYDEITKHDLGIEIMEIKPVRFDSRFYKYDVCHEAESIPIGFAQIIEYANGYYLGLLYTLEGISQPMQATFNYSIDEVKGRLTQKYGRQLYFY